MPLASTLPRSLDLRSAYRLQIIVLVFALCLLLNATEASAQGCAHQQAPTTPSVSATKGKAKITVTWNAAAEADGYWVYKSSDGGNFLQINGGMWGIGYTSPTSFNDTGVQNGHTYSYFVIAYNCFATGNQSNIATQSVVLDPPSVSAVAGKAKITVNWNAVTDADYYQAYKYLNGQFVQTGNLAGMSYPTRTSVVDTGVANGQSYTYMVISCNNAGCSNWSNTPSATVRLDPPSVTAVAGKAKVTVSWNAVADADYYQAYKYVNGQFVQTGNLAGMSYPTRTSVVDTGVANGQSYTYMVISCNNAGCSNWSNTPSATVRLDPPTGMTASMSSGQVLVSWGTVPDADYYWAYKSSDGGEFLRVYGGYGISFTSPTSFTDTAVANGHTYRYFAIALNNAGGSNWSAIASTSDRDGMPRPEDSCACPLDSGPNPGGGSGPSAPDPVNLATGRESYQPAPDLEVYNPSGPGVAWGLSYHGYLALKGYGAPGLAPGWTHVYDVQVLGPDATGTWGPLKLYYPNGAMEILTPALDGNGQPTGQFILPVGSGHFARGVAGATTGQWQSVTLTWRDQTQWRLTPLVPGTYVLSSLTNRTGQSVNLTWGANRTPAQITDASSGTVLLNFAYTEGGQLAAATDAYSRKVVYTYGVPYGSSLGNLQTVSQVVAASSDNAPARYSYTYATSGGQQLSTMTVPSPTGSGSSTATITYDDGGRVASLVDANGNRRVYLYGATGTQVQVKDAANNLIASWTRKFNLDLRDAGTTDSANRSTLAEYNDPQNPAKPTRVVDANNKATTYTYDQFGNLLTTTNPRGVTTTYTWDYTAFAIGRLISVQEGTRPATTFSYFEPSGLVQSVTGPAPAGNNAGTVTTSYTYDALGNVLSVTGAGNNAAAQITTTYNYTIDGGYTQAAKLGQPLTVTDNLGHQTHLRYDAQGRVVSATDALGNQTDAAYNLVGQPESVTLPATNQTGAGRGRTTNSYLYTGGPLVTTTIYDESNVQARQVTRAYGPEGETLAVAGSTEPVTYSYDALYRLKTLKDGNNNATTYTYNGVGQLARVLMPGGESVQFPSYDAAGNLLQRIDGNNVTTNYLYADAENQLTDIQYPATPGLNVHFGYDNYGRRSSMTDGTGSHGYTYGNRDELLSQTTTYTGLPAQTIAYAYYPDGGRQTMTTPAGTFTYNYDAAGRPTSLTNPFGETSSWAYFDNNRLNTQTLPNGAPTTYSYNALGQMSELVNKTSGGMTLSQFSQMAHDGAGNRTTLTASLPAVASLSGTTSYLYDAKNQLTQEQTTRGGGFTDSFGYDAAGNPTSYKGAAKTYNQNNQQTTTGFAHDGNGNPTSYNGTTLTFDAENRLTSFGTTLTAGYTGDGLRAWKQSAAGRTYFLYDGTLPIIEMDASGSVTATNTFGAQGLVSRRANAQSIFYTFDAQGGVTQRLDAAGGVLSSHQFTAHGSELTTPSADPFGYGAQWGYYTDRETGLQLLTHRYYDPNAGRFLTRDPISYNGGINLYGYTANRPTGKIDPYGLSIFGVSGGVSAFGGIEESSAGGTASAGYVYSTNPPEQQCGCDKGRLVAAPVFSAGGLLFPNHPRKASDGQEGVFGFMAGAGGGVIVAPSIDNINDLSGESDSLLVSIGPWSLQIDDTGNGNVYTISFSRSWGGGFAHFKSHTYVPPCPTSPKYPLTPNGPIPMPLPTPTP